MMANPSKDEALERIQNELFKLRQPSLQANSVLADPHRDDGDSVAEARFSQTTATWEAISEELGKLSRDLQAIADSGESPAVFPARGTVQSGCNHAKAHEAGLAFLKPLKNGNTKDATDDAICAYLVGQNSQLRSVLAAMQTQGDELERCCGREAEALRLQIRVRDIMEQEKRRLEAGEGYADEPLADHMAESGSLGRDLSQSNNAAQYRWDSRFEGESSLASQADAAEEWAGLAITQELRHECHRLTRALAQLLETHFPAGSIADEGRLPEQDTDKDTMVRSDMATLLEALMNLSLEPTAQYLKLNPENQVRGVVDLLQRANVVERHNSDPTLIRLVRFHI